MNTRIAFRNMEPAAAIENYAHEHMKKIEKFLENEPTPVYIDLVMEPSKTREHNRVELLIKTPHYELMCEKEGPHFYKVLDQVLDCMIQQLHEAKRKRVDEVDHRLKVSKLREFREEVPEDNEEERK